MTKFRTYLFLLLGCIVLAFPVFGQSGYFWNGVLAPPSGASQWGSMLFNFVENPAFAGVGHVSVLRYQGEFPRLGLSAPHHRQTAAVDFPFRRWKTGWGVWWQHDRVPYAFDQRAGLQFSKAINLYNRRFMLKGNHHLRFGLGVNVAQSRLLDLPANLPPRNPAPAKQEWWGGDLQVGMWYTYRTFYTGVSLSGILRPRSIWQELPETDFSGVRSGRSLRWVAGWNVDLPRRWALHPFFSLSWQNGQRTYRAALLVFHRYHVGTGLSVDDRAAYAHLQLNIKRFRFGYAWGWDRNEGLRSQHNGTHQLNLTYVFK